MRWSDEFVRRSDHHRRRVRCANDYCCLSAIIPELLPYTTPAQPDPNCPTAYTELSPPPLYIRGARVLPIATPVPASAIMHSPRPLSRYPRWVQRRSRINYAVAMPESARYIVRPVSHAADEKENRISPRGRAAIR